MKIIDQRPTTCQVNMPMTEVPVGTVFKGQIGYLVSTFLKCYFGVVDLVNPSSTWERGDTIIQDYRPLNVELVIKGEID